MLCAWFTSVGDWISGIEDCRRLSAEETLLLGLGVHGCFGEKGWEMTESRPRP
jgi:hypothetical protein